MIFIYEPQQLIPNDCSEDYKICYPIRDASNQYNFLIQLDSEIIKKIQEIYFVYPKGMDIKIYENMTPNYYSEISKYDDPDLRRKIWENTLLPTSINKSDDEKNTYITKLIQKQIFVEETSKLFSILRSGDGGDLLMYLPSKRVLTETFITEGKANNLILYSNTTNMKLKDGEQVVQVNPKRYIDIHKKLNKIRKQSTSDIASLPYKYNPKTLFILFENTLLSRMNNVLSSNTKRLRINGEERLLALRCINHLLISQTPLYYDLVSGVPPMVTDSTSLVFLNYDTLIESEDYHKLYHLTKNFDLSKYIILQAFRNKYSEYFNNYEEIDLPNSETIYKLISELFVALLWEKNKISEDIHLLYSLLNSNSFAELFNKVPKLEHIEKIISKLEKLTPLDLSQNVDLWYFIITEIEKLEKNLKTKMNYKVKKKILFEYTGKNWEIIGLSKKTQLIPNNYGIKYIALIILYFQFYNKPIDVSKLRFLANRIDDLSLSEKMNIIELENDRSSISSALKLIQEDSFLKEFCTRHIKYSKYEYKFENNDEIECEISHPRLNEDFIKDLD